MKSIIKLSLTAIIAIVVVLSSCGKYEDGPKISFASKKGRLERVWKLEKSISGANGTETPCTANCPLIEFKKDGSVTQNGVTWTGTKWQFSSDKSKLEFVYTILGTTTTTSMKILRLTSKELWIKDESNNDQDHYEAN